MFHKAPPLAPPRKRVLVADDDEATLEIVATKLRRDGYEVHQAHAGDEALALLATLRDADYWHDQVDLLVLDVHMPRMTGVGVLRKIRARRDSTPAVLMTGASDPDLLAAADTLHAQVITKPFSLAQLSDAAAVAIAAREAQRA